MEQLAISNLKLLCFKNPFKTVKMSLKNLEIFLKYRKKKKTLTAKKILFLSEADCPLKKSDIQLLQSLTIEQNNRTAYHRRSNEIRGFKMAAYYSNDIVP